MLCSCIRKWRKISHAQPGLLLTVTSIAFDSKTRSSSNLRVFLFCCVKYFNSYSLTTLTLDKWLFNELSPKLRESSWKIRLDSVFVALLSFGSYRCIERPWRYQPHSFKVSIGKWLDENRAQTIARIQQGHVRSANATNYCGLQNIERRCSLNSPPKQLVSFTGTWLCCT